MLYAYRYFGWVAQIQGALQYWKKKFCEGDVNYDEILLYETTLLTLNEKIYPVSLLMKCQEVKKINMIFLHEFETLNVLLLLCIPGQPDAQWCSLPALLEAYGVYLPQEAHNLISRKVVFPDQEWQIPDELLSKAFLPGNDISLKLDKHMTLKELKSLVQGVTSFQHKFLDLNKLVFFKLNKSVLFEDYLQHYLKKLSKSPQDSTADSKFLLSGITLPPVVATCVKQDLALQNLLSAIKCTGALVGKIMSGTATYSDITADDELMLQQLDIERELSTLSRYGRGSTSPMASAYSEELKGVQSLLELFQYTKHIKVIQAVCKQYHLLKCIDDPLLEELVHIVEDPDRSKITQDVATQKMMRVKTILKLDEDKTSKCLDIFAAISDSASFYQFVKDKQFEGPQGQANFLQQYHLITAQLQHEQYDEQVLNHLQAAFKVISPFMDANKSFSKLMEEVTPLNAVNGRKQLKTVNTNITLIRLWFSRAEVRTDCTHAFTPILLPFLLSYL